MKRKSAYTTVGQNVMAIAGLIIFGSIALFVQNGMKAFPDMGIQLLLYYAFQGGCAIFVFGLIMMIVGSIIQAIWQGPGDA
jgi:uncharacterized membrane protein